MQKILPAMLALWLNYSNFDWGHTKQISFFRPNKRIVLWEVLAKEFSFECNPPQVFILKSYCQWQSPPSAILLSVSDRHTIDSRWTLTKPEPFIDYFTAIKCICYPFETYYQPKWQIFLPLYFNKGNIPFHIPESWKMYLFWVEPPRTGHYRAVPHREFYSLDPQIYFLG